MAKDLQIFEKAVKESFNKVKAELTEHLDSINDNTLELQSHQQSIAQIEEKVDKLSERVERLLLLFEEQQKPKVQELHLREQEVFAILYAAPGHLSLRDISHKTGLPTDMIEDLIDSLLAKGVRVDKKLQHDTLCVALTEDFRLLQTKTNVVSINEQILKQVQ